MTAQQPEVHIYTGVGFTLGSSAEAPKEKRHDGVVLSLPGRRVTRFL